MKRASMLDLRLDLEGIIGRVQKGRRMVLTRRGKPVARWEPMAAETPDADDPFCALSDLAEAGPTLSNAPIDELLSGQ